MAKRVVFVSSDNYRVILGEDFTGVYLSHRGYGVYQLSICSKYSERVCHNLNLGGVVGINEAKQTILSTVERWLDPYDGVMVRHIDFVKEIEALLGGFNGVSNH